MPKINTQNHEQSQGSPLEVSIHENLPTIVVGTSPVLIVGVNRKLNTGSYENLDIFAGISLPMPNASLEDLDELRTIVEETATVAFQLTSKEVNERYERLRAARSGRPQSTESPPLPAGA